MKKLFFLIIVLLCPLAVHAEGMNSERGMIGAGIVIGGPTGVCGKYWVTNYQAVDAVFSVVGENNVYLRADYLFHDFRALPAPEEGKLPLYYGPGFEIESKGTGGIRAVIGVDYLFKDYPFDIFLQIAPVLKFSPTVSLSFSGGFGARYYWR
jgi:hypothetical protein